MYAITNLENEFVKEVGTLDDAIAFIEGEDRVAFEEGYSYAEYIIDAHTEYGDPIERFYSTAGRGSMGRRYTNVMLTPAGSILGTEDQSNWEMGNTP